MKPIYAYSLLLSFFLLSILACRPALQNEDAALQLIPAEASSVTVLRIPELMEKADFENFQKLPVYQRFVEEAREENATLGKIAEKPYESGVDLDQNFYLFSELSKDNPEDMLTGMLIPLRDPAAFEAMIDSWDAGEIEQKADYNFLKTSSSTS